MANLLAEVWSSNDAGTLWHTKYWEDGSRYFSTHTWHGDVNYTSKDEMMKAFRKRYREAKKLEDKPFTRVRKAKHD